MADKIMPLSEAVEGYDLFDKMKVQKGMQTQPQQHIPKLRTSSGIRSTEVTRWEGCKTWRKGACIRQCTKQSPYAFLVIVHIEWKCVRVT